MSKVALTTTIFGVRRLGGPDRSRGGVDNLAAIPLSIEALHPHTLLRVPDRGDAPKPGKIAIP